MTDNVLAQGRKAVKNDTTPVVFVVDDDVSVRESLELLIDFAKWRPRLFDSAQAFLEQPQPAVPSCLVLDINLPDLNGLDLQNMIGHARPDLPIIFLTGYGDVPLTVRAMKAGAVEFLTKPFDDDVLLRAISDALDHSRAVQAREDGLRSLRDAHATLTPRENEVLRMVIAGRLNKVIASDLGISEITVKAHRGKVMRKMKARSVADLVRMAALLDLS
jgi:FixJ family two-component response regulator